MKYLYYIFIVLILTIGCSEKKKKTTQPINKSKTVDHTEIKNKKNKVLIDTIYSINYHNEKYKIVITDTTCNLDEHKGFLHKKIQLINTKNDSIFERINHFNTRGAIETYNNDISIIHLFNYGGGSGYAGSLFLLLPDRKNALIPICSTNELSYWKVFPEQKKIIFFQGMWNFLFSEETPDDLESHFEAHIQHISIIELKNDNIKINKIGHTKFKYDPFIDDSTLIKLQKQEPELYLKLSIHE